MFAISVGVPTLFNGCFWPFASTFCCEFSKDAARGVLVNDGAIQFTRIVGANSAARARVKPSTAPLEAATCA